MSIGECTFLIGERRAIGRRVSWFAATGLRRRAVFPGENRFLNRYQHVHNRRAGAHFARIFTSMQLTEQERTIIADRVAVLEARTGTQVVTAVVAKSDSYPEAPWKAFALGAAAAALACVIWQLTGRSWSVDTPQTAHVLVILASGALFALLAILHAPFARLFVDRIRRDLEATQFAQSLFFGRRLDRTRRRMGVLLLVSVFERKVVILADEGFDGRIEARDWAGLTRRIAFLLRHSTTATALQAGLEAMEALLLERGFAGSGSANELPDAPLEPKDRR